MTIYLLAYDAEDRGCRRLVDWVQARDQHGRVVSFPFQNGELVRVAPELAGLPQVAVVYGYDTGTHSVHSGPGMLPGLLGLLPGWAWLALPARLPLVARVLYRLLCRG